MSTQTTSPAGWPENVPFFSPWDGQSVQAALEAYVALNDGILPGRPQMVADGLKPLYVAMANNGGVRHWRSRFARPTSDLLTPPDGWPEHVPFPDYRWDEDAVRAALTAYVGNDGEAEVPPVAQMRADGLELLYRKMASHGSVRYWRSQFPVSRALQEETELREQQQFAQERYQHISELRPSVRVRMGAASPSLPDYPLAVVDDYSSEPAIIYYTVAGFLDAYDCSLDGGCDSDAHRALASYFSEGTAHVLGEWQPYEGNYQVYDVRVLDDDVLMQQLADFQDHHDVYFDFL